MTLHLEKNAPGFRRKSVLLFTNLESWYKVFCGFYLVTVYRWFTTYRCSPSRISSQEDSIHSLKRLTLKGHKISKEKLQSAQTQVRYLEHLISERWLRLDPDSLHGTLNSYKPKTKNQLQGFLRLAGYSWNWIPNFSLMAQPLYALLKPSKPDRINWGGQDDTASEGLKKSLLRPPTLGHSNYQLPFSLLYVRRKGMPLEYSPPNMGTIIDP